MRSSTLAELLRVHGYLHSKEFVAAVEERVKEKGCSPLQAAFDVREEFRREFEAGRPRRASQVEELLRDNGYLHSEDFVAAVEERVKEKGCSPLQAAFEIREEFRREFEAGRPRRARRVEELLREYGYAVDPDFVSIVMHCCETGCQCFYMDALRV
jgi:hypothetical protein